MQYGQPPASVCVEPMMIWPFNRFNNSRPGSEDTIGTIYGMIVAQAREPVFYAEFGVPDSVDGRFDLLLLHLWLVLRRLRQAKGRNGLSQALFDHFCNDMDANLREMGVGDLTVPKRMQAFGEAFYGRSAAYDAALADGPEALSQAISKNVLNGQGLDQSRRLADYVEASAAKLAGIDDLTIARGTWKFAALVPPHDEV